MNIAKKMSTSLTTAPTSEPLTLAQAKAFLRIEDTSEDDLITSLIKAARTAVENYTSYRMFTQTWTSFLDGTPYGGGGGEWWDGVRSGHISTVYGAANCVVMPFGPLQSMTISSFAADDTETTFSSSNYYVDTNRNPGRVCLNEGSSWPTDIRDHSSIKFVGVYGHSSVDDIPADLVEAVRMVLAEFYEKRCEDPSAVPVMSGAVKSYLAPYVKRAGL